MSNFFFFYFTRDNALENFSNGFNNFLSRKKLKPSDIAKELELKNSSVSMWKTGRGFPEFSKLCKLFEMGMTFKEMFGERLANQINENEKNAEKNAFSLMDENKKMFDNLKNELDEKAHKIEDLEKELKAAKDNGQKIELMQKELEKLKKDFQHTQN